MASAEGVRVQGSRLKISGRPAIVSNFEIAPIATMSVNDRTFASYEYLLGDVEPWNLNAF